MAQSEFEENDGVLSCRAGTYLAFTESSARCYTKKDCPGYIINGAECRVGAPCPMLLHEDESGRECIDEAACAAMGLETFTNDSGTRLCIKPTECPDKGGYYLRIEQKTTCVNATACSELGKHAYFTTRECDAQEPSPDGNFEEEAKKGHVYKCNEDHPYLDTSGEQATCTSIEKCVADNKLEYVSDDEKQKLCVTRTKCLEIGYALRIQCLTRN